MTSEEKLLLNRFKDLDRMALNKNKAFFTNFLDAYEYSLFLDHVNDFNSHTGIYDLIDDLERQMVFFHPDAFCDSVDFPITILKIMPKSAKFKGEISHRDILGTLMGLQIERKYIGDIRILENGEILVLCVDSVADLIIESVDRIRHTDVMISRVENISDFNFCQKFINKYGSLASNRLDAVVSECFNLSRSAASDLIKSECVFVNSKLESKATKSVSTNDKISVRKHGKVKITDIGEENRKGKIKISYSIYS